MSQGGKGSAFAAHMGFSALIVLGVALIHPQGAAAKGTGAVDGGVTNAAAGKSGKTASTRKQVTLPEPESEETPAPTMTAPKAADDVPDYDARLVALRQSLSRVKELRDQDKKPQVASEVWEMRSVVKRLEEETLGGKQSVAARALLNEAQDLCTTGGADDLLDTLRDTPDLGKMELKRRALVRQLVDLEANGNESSADNLRGKLIELTRDVRKKGFPAPDPP